MSEMAEFFSTEDPEGSKAGEFSGVGGLIQPAPHDPAMDASESLSLLMAQDRDDLTEWLESKQPEE